MSKGTITRKGLLLLGRILTSCLPTRGKFVTKNHSYVVQKARTGAEISFSRFVDGLPVPDSKYLQMMALASGLDKSCIDEEVVAIFFGGEPHFETASTQVESMNLERNRARMIYFAHIMAEVQIESIHPGIRAVYRNNKREVVTENLVSLLKGVEVKPGERYFAHYSSIVAPADFIQKSTRKLLLEMQSKDGRFMDACSNIDGIDYSKLWRFKDWTRKHVEKSGYML